jgi:hypothetical protein
MLIVVTAIGNPLGRKKVGSDEDATVRGAASSLVEELGFHLAT